MSSEAGRAVSELGEEETWDPGVERWRGEGDHVLPASLRSLPLPWDGPWSEIERSDRTPERLVEAQHVLTVLLDDPALAPSVPEPPSPGLLLHAWEELEREVWARMPRTGAVTWSGVDLLVREKRERGGLYVLQERALSHIEAVMLNLIRRTRDDIADSVFRWLAMDPEPRRFAEWAVDMAGRCVVAGIGSDMAIELLGSIGTGESPL
ncbi:MULTISPECIES: hypothetical protein [Nonomuraea]|uniref:Uncharacterized protein n=1 Tax=Nonomuraea mangrovi TaxID=2316207 RepID=A0ABW4T0N3_9ACTN